MGNQPSKPSTRPASFQELRGPSGRLYGYIDLERMVVEFKRGGQAAETIDLSQLRATVNSQRSQ